MKENKTLSSLVGGFMAIAIATACLPSIDKILNGDKEEYENLAELETEEIDLDKKLDIKRLINDDGELI